MIEFRSLEFFYWIAKLRSFSQAAKVMKATQPAVSQRIAALEAALGMQLLTRSGRTNSLTPQGEIVARYSERFLALRNEMMAELEAPPPARRIVRLGVSETITRMWLRDFLDRVAEALPDVDVHLSIDLSPRMYERLLGSELDLCFYLIAQSDPRLITQPLFQCSQEFIAATDFPIGAEPLEVDTLRRVPIMTYHHSTSPYQMLFTALKEPGGKAPILFENNSLTSIVEMTLERVGICVLPSDVVLKELERGQLRIIETRVPLPQQNFVTAYRREESEGLHEQLCVLAREVASAHVETSRARHIARLEAASG